MKNLEQVRKNRLDAKRHKEELQVYQDLKQAVEDLKAAVSDQDSIDLSPIIKSLDELPDQINIQSSFSSLEESVRATLSQLSHLSKTKNTVDFSKLTKVLEKYSDIKPQVTVNAKAVDVAMEYRASDADLGDPNSYYGFLHPTGKWYIMRQSGLVSANWRYTVGASDYRGSWTKRSNLDYKLYSEITL